MKNSFLAFAVLAVSGVSASPMFNATAFQALGKRVSTNVITECTQPNTVALTFDDGPWIYHEEVSKALINAGAKGTFFVNGDNYDCIYTESVANMLIQSFKDGNQIASHTWSHPDLTTLSPDQVQDQLSRIDTALEKILGVKSAFLRPPYGSYSNAVLAAVADNGQRTVTWDFDSGDSTGSTPAQSKAAYDALFAKKPNNILALNHETEETTVHQVLPYVLEKYGNSGYQFVTVAECLGMDAYITQGPPGTRDSSWTCD